MEIRQLTLQDVEERFLELMADIETGDSFDFADPQWVGWLKRKIARRWGAGAQFYGLFAADEPIGLLGLIIDDHPYFAGRSELVDLGVMPTHRRAGHGTRLLKYAEQLSREAGVVCMYISTYAGDTQNITFYGQNGFAPVATLPDFYGVNDEGQVYMRKRLMGEK
ncbi:MAG: GNAT family N-acetyltransferase [Chloroflexi bacterium]|nr:GNAT family N-acetyltransferase [Chloroflexota bacterium]